jgi:DNA invertase Pin-like site-specific DNA recombinase
MLVGYARTSTTDQETGLAAQQKALKAAGAKKIFAEQVSSVDRKREQLAATLDFIREGDTLIVTKLDRLARSVANLVEIGQRIDAKQATLRILDMNLDTKTPTGQLMLNLIGSIAQFEREIMLERQHEGIALAKAEGRYKGRKPTVRAKAEQVKALKAQGLSQGRIAAQLKISRTSVHYILNGYPS